jgi:flagellar biosynthetic protein FlhB
MAEGGDDQEKSEEPSTKKIEEARKKGQVAFSREVTSFFMFLVLALTIIWIFPAITLDVIGYLRRFLVSPEDIRINFSNFSEIMASIIKASVFLFIFPILATLIAAFLSSFLQNGILFSSEPIMPKLDKISPLAGFKRLFSLKSFMEFLKGLFKITIIGVSSYVIIESELKEIIFSSNLSIKGFTELALIIAFKIVLAASIFMLVVAVLDYTYQKYEYMKNLRMSKQELKEEFKQTEGDPQIKAKLRQIREERAKRRMVSKVPEADVVIRNPTHYAIALEYKDGQMAAPIVVAMGQDNIALNIIKIAENSEVPVITNRNLAKALYETAELDEEIPLEHYKAVAEIIAYVFKMKKGVG